MKTYQATARNFSETHENKIHSDEMAQKYGFKGALVPGVAVYGHCTLPLTDTLGVDWLSNSTNSLRLLKPAYHQDQLTLALIIEGEQYTVECRNDEGTVLAVVQSHFGVAPEPDFLGQLEASYKPAGRPEITWDSITPLQPFEPWQQCLSAEMNAQYTSEVGDEQALFEEGYVHPHLIQSLANTVLTREYMMPAWIHVGTETRHRAALNIDDTITIKSIPLEKWQNKGHEFIRVGISFWRGDDLTTDMLHTAIYKVAD